MCLLIGLVLLSRCASVLWFSRLASSVFLSLDGGSDPVPDALWDAWFMDMWFMSRILLVLLATWRLVGYLCLFGGFPGDIQIKLAMQNPYGYTHRTCDAKSLRIHMIAVCHLSVTLVDFASFRLGHVWPGFLARSLPMDFAFRCPSFPCFQCHVESWVFRSHLCFSRFMLLLFALSCRVGEAVVPGPQAHYEGGGNEGVQWQLGICNPAGFPTKAHLIALSPVDVWLASETHLTVQGHRDFVRQLALEGSRYEYCIMGCPVPPRTLASDVGTWNGVAILSKHPTRRMQHVWDRSLMDTGRVLCASTFLHDFWLNSVIVYGTPTGGTHPKAKATTEALLAAAVNCIAQMDGPRVLGGDFNHDLESFACIDQLKAMHFVEVQDLFFARTGVLPRPTCKRKTRRDFMFLSSDLVPLFEHLDLDYDQWIDHASLIATFRGTGKDLCKYLWPLPQPLPWNLVRNMPPRPPVEFGEASCSKDYRQFWSQIEDDIEFALRDRGRAFVAKAKGRGQRVAPLVCAASSCAVSSGRSGELQPQHFGISFLHKHWFRQLRRLQSLVKICGAATWTLAHSEHRASLWNAVLRAPGFKPCFRSWWSNRRGAIGDPLVLPVTPPELDLALLIFQAFEVDVRDLEVRLNQSRARRLPSAGSALKTLYQEVKRDAPMSVDVLVDTKVSHVVEIDEADVAVVIDPPVDFQPDFPLISNGQILAPTMITSDKIYLETCDPLKIGSSIVQTCRTGRLVDVFKAFQEQWSTRWGRHADIPASQWDRIVAFGRHRLGKIDGSPLQLTVPLIRAVAKSKRAQAAVGLDGVRRSDVVNLPPNGVLSLLNLFQQAQASGSWPDQITQGVVRSLAKSAEPCHTGDFRPITVFSFIYRLWSSLQSRFWISRLDALLDQHLCGNRSNHRAASLWHYVLESVELAQHDDLPLCGVNFDLEKAYNLLPRYPVFALAACAGIHQSVLVGWAGALSNMARRFFVRGSLGPPVLATCGFPEGCGLSCVAMMLIDQVWHEWVKADVALATPLSFVDNWEILVSQPELVEEAMASTFRFAAALDLVVDHKKTFCWGTTRYARKLLTSRGLQVRLDTKDLGAHVTFSKQVRNASCVGRFQGLADFWEKLANVVGSFDLKKQVVFAAAWPRALHAIGASFVGDKHFQRLRSEYMRAMKMNKPGANSYLQLCIDGCGVDPMLAAIKASLADFRDLGGGPVQLEVLSSIVRAECESGIGALHQVLVHRIHKLGWEVGEAGLCKDRFGWFSLRDLHWNELVHRLELGWQLVVASHLQHREDFTFFHRANISATRVALAALSPYDRGIARHLLNGATLTNQHACHWSLNGSHLCAGCGARDSLEHRFWSCPMSGSLRASLPSPVLEIVPVLPDILTLHGWTLQSSVHDAWCRYLLSIPDPPRFIQGLPWPVCGVVDLFTDGSCLWPVEGDFRLAAWSVCYSAPASVDASAFQSHVVAAGPLQGLYQSAFRAELQAVVVALDWALSCPSSISGVRLWIDCQGVLDKMLLLLDGLQRPKLTGPNGDLWQALVDKAGQFGRSRIWFAKVAAHVEESDQTTALDTWFALGNAAADRAARQANFGRPPAAWDLWERHAAEVCGHRALGDTLRTFQLAVCKLWTTQFGGDSDKKVPVEPKQAKRFVMGFQCDNSVVEVCPPLVKHLGRQFTELLRQWWVDAIDIRSQDSGLSWVSFAHLYVAFQQATGHPGLIRKERGWADPLGNSLLLPQNYAFQVRARWFRMCLQQAWKCWNLKVSTAVTRPCGSMIVGFFGCCSVPLQNGVLDRADSWLRGKLRGPIRGTGRALSSLPLV